MKAFAESAKGQPYAFVVYQPGGNAVNESMTPNLVKQWGSDTLAALLAAWVLALGALGFARRVAKSADPIPIRASGRFRAGKHARNRFMLLDQVLFCISHNPYYVKAPDRALATLAGLPLTPAKET